MRSQFHPFLSGRHNDSINFPLKNLNDNEIFSSGLSSKRIILSPFTKEFRGEGHSYESLNFSGATNVAIYF